ncbi:MAG: hypothetical protein RhofKO_07160 [Rhodothermales bacterium]
MPTLTATRLQPVHPAPEALVEGGAAEFYWLGPARTTYVFQIATDETFAADVFEATVTDTTLLTVFEVLPERGDRYFWRVRLASDADGWTTPSPFIATHQDHIVQTNQQVTKAQRQADLGASSGNPSASDVPATPTDVWGTTSSAMAVGMIALMFGTFGTLLGILIAVMA